MSFESYIVDDLGEFVPSSSGSEAFMFAALREAQKAYELGEVPIGAVAVKHNQIIGRAYNQVELLKDATAHAEILLVTQVAAAQGDWRLDEVDIYVTKEPCAMCAGAMVNSRVRKVYFGMSDERCGACGGALDVAGFSGMLHQVEVEKGLLEIPCKALVQSFFKTVRAQKKQPETVK